MLLLLLDESADQWTEECAEALSDREDAIRYRMAAECVRQVLSSMSDKGVAEEWCWEWDENRDAQWNTYRFNCALDLHKWRWRRWEEMHNASCCVVERVRDKYVMPRVREFLAALDVHRGGHG